MGNFQALCLIVIQLCGPLESLLRKIIPTKPIIWNKIELVVPWNFRGWARSWRQGMSSAFECPCSCTQVSLRSQSLFFALPHDTFFFNDFHIHFKAPWVLQFPRSACAGLLQQGTAPCPVPSPPWLPSWLSPAWPQATELISTAPHQHTTDKGYFSHWIQILKCISPYPKQKFSYQIKLKKYL